MKQYECKDCPNRTRACHENCESYLAIKKARAEEKKARAEDTKLLATIVAENNISRVYGKENGYQPWGGIKMYICNRCGETTDEIESYTEWHGAEGTSNYGAIEFDKPCHCGGCFVEAKRCHICEEYFDPDNMYDGICEECLKKETTEENAYKVGEECKESVKINGFLKSVFNQSEIEQILKNAYNEIPQVYKNNYINKYCLEDITAFAEQINKW